MDHLDVSGHKNASEDHKDLSEKNANTTVQTHNQEAIKQQKNDELEIKQEDHLETKKEQKPQKTEEKTDIDNGDKASIYVGNVAYESKK